MNFRRTLLKSFAGILPITLMAKSKLNASPSVMGKIQLSKRDYYKELNITPFINAAGAYSVFGGARMREETINAMRYAATRKVKINTLHDAVGEKIAKLTGAQAAMVTSGATASIVLGTAACMTGADEKKMQQLPNTTNIKDEIIIQKKTSLHLRQSVDRCWWKINRSGIRNRHSSSHQQKNCHDVFS